MCEIWKSAGKKLTKFKRTWNDLSMLFYTKGCKKNMGFEEFLEILPIISFYLEPEIEKEKGFKNMMNYLSLVYEHKIEPEIHEKVINEEEVNEQTR